MRRLVVWFGLCLACASSGGAQTRDSVITVTRDSTSRTVWEYSTTTRIVVTVTAPPQILPSLGALASARGFQMGTAVHTDANTLVNDATYAALLASAYNSVTPENATIFGVIEPSQNRFDFTHMDEVVSLAQANGMAIHGQNLVWGNWLPSWVTGGLFTKAQLLSLLKNHLTAVVGRYRGKMTSWVMVNEAVIWNGTLRPNIWLTTIGAAYIDSAFVWAHRTDPTAKLYYNEYSIEGPGPKTDSVFALLQRLKTRGVPIDGVGFQFHNFPVTSLPAASSVRANFARFANAGFDIRITEMDVMIPDTAPPSARIAQAVVFRDILDACLLQPRCTGLTTWGFTDRYSWIPKSWPGYGRGLPLDSAYRAQPGFDSLAARLRRP